MKHFIHFLLAVLCCVNMYGQTANCQFTKPTFVNGKDGGLGTFTPETNPKNPRTTDLTKKRIIFWIHGLGGDSDSWARAAQATAYQSPGQQIPGYPPRKAECLTPAYSQFSLNGAGYNLHTKLVSMGDPICATNHIEDKTINFLIAHSQGGLVSRSADKYYADQGIEDQRRFGGIVTFGTPHLGAQILNNVDMHAPLVNEGCDAVSAGPIAAEVYDVTDVPFFGLGIYRRLSEVGTKVCNFFTDKILPIMLEGQQVPITSDFRVGAAPLNELNGYESTLPKVAFYGVENDPVVWREFYSFYYKTPNEFPAFTADEDNILFNQVTALINLYNDNYLMWKQRGDWHDAHWRHNKAKACWDIANKYLKGYQWLCNANDKFLAVIGAVSQQTQTITTGTCECSNGATSFTFPINDISQCSMAGANCFAQTSTTVVTNTVIKPNDGTVLAESAAGFSGALTEEMTGSNHQQMRNDSNLKTKLNNLFSGAYGNYFKTEAQ